MLKIAYCSNVHAGADLQQTKQNLAEHALGVKDSFRPEGSMGIGLWLSANTASELVDESNKSLLERFQGFLRDNEFDPFTFNGFPYGNFHQQIVKKSVYLPTWYETDRLTYTKQLVDLITTLSGSNELSISTLPIGWGEPTPSAESLNTAAANLREIAEYCAKAESETGKLVHICIEPEPGCYIQYGRDLVSFYESYLLREGNEEQIRRHIRICHDVCHAVVMCEDQCELLDVYRKAGILVGKVQVSSAVVVDFDSLEPSLHPEAVAQIREFAEDRYMHQTTIQDASGAVRYFDDLPIALKESDRDHNSGVWRIHFHVPIYLQQFGLLSGSRNSIESLLRGCRKYSDVSHFEVETYAWNVLPEHLQHDSLAEGIAKELQWFETLATSALGANAS